MNQGNAILKLHGFISDCAGPRLKSQPGKHRMLRLASHALCDAEAIKESDLLHLGLRLRRQALLVSEILEQAYACEFPDGPALREISEALSLSHEAQSLLNDAMESGSLCPAYFLELNADWARLSHFLDKMNTF